VPRDSDLLRQGGQADDETATGAGVVHSDGASVCLHQAAGDGEAEAGAAGERVRRAGGLAAEGDGPMVA